MKTRRQNDREFELTPEQKQLFQELALYQARAALNLQAGNPFKRVIYQQTALSFSLADDTFNCNLYRARADSALKAYNFLRSR